MTNSGVCERAPAVVTVLFVDDDDDARFAYKLIATDEGMLVLLARDGQEAIALANVEMPDVIVLDVGLRSMDGLDGFEVARRLRADQRTSTIPIVFLTGYNGARHLAAVVASGCEGHLVKPCSAQALLDLVSKLAMHRRDKAIRDDAQASSA